MSVGLEAPLLPPAEADDADAAPDDPADDASFTVVLPISLANSAFTSSLDCET